ncbi:tyrosinase family protein [Aspergillus candidus]|uniref:Putative tyrosinase n=1 Tax=Aspergillus candidus TaxID=41067 RepID=A0A2I2FHN1_ASPCN|nr:putative tyrosinase [Aspergillus candidus]PLB40132.1 putative tyrosinase [Aspergillus candidus]
MRWHLVATAALLAFSPASASPTDPWDVLAGKALHNQAHYHSKHKGDGSCNPKTASVRREWGSLSKRERKDYTSAVNCLHSKPSKSDPSFAPGARNRYDDFVAVHINQTIFIHATGSFLTWHRYFTWAYEQALRNECGYKGAQPYYAWNKYAADPLSSPMFDGSEYSMSGDGSFVEHEGPEAAPGIILKPGKGGGCITSGPFKNWEVNLGPVLPSLKIPGLEPPQNDPTHGLGYNPRCLRRDISTDASRWTATEHVIDLIKNYPTIGKFQDRMQGDFPNKYLGVHSGGHYTIGGDPGGDFAVSPGDPAFFLHHAAIDRAFWTWQNLDPSKRTFVAEGPSIMPGLGVEAPNVTLDYPIDLSNVLAAPKTIRELSDTAAGPFCYVYL